MCQRAELRHDGHSAAHGHQHRRGYVLFPRTEGSCTVGTKISILTQLKKNFNIPIDDDYLYEEFGIDKPANYEQLKAEQDG